MDVENFKSLFVHRADMFAQQQASGAYSTIKNSLTDEIIQSHLNGERTIGLYQLDTKDNTIKWACLDIDIDKSVSGEKNFDMEVWKDIALRQANIAKELFQRKNIPSYIEFSGNKGYHVWVFFIEPVPADIIKAGMETLFKYMTKVDPKINWEIFPKQSKVSVGSFGNLVKGPLGYHNKSKKFSEFIDHVSAESINYADPENFIFKTDPREQTILQCAALRNAWNSALEEKKASNTLRTVLAYLFLNMDGGEEYFIENFLSKMDNYNEDITKKALEHMKASKYLPIECKTLQTDAYNKICPMRCAEIGSHNSPIYFYHKTKFGNTTSGEIESGAINVQDELFKSGESYYIRKKAGDKLFNVRLTNFSVDFTECQTYDRGTHWETYFSGNIQYSGNKYPFKISAEEYSKNDTLTSKIYNTIGIQNVLLTDVTNTRLAINKFTKMANKKVTKNFGFVLPKDGPNLLPTSYATPSIFIDKDGIRKNEEIEIDLSDVSFNGQLDMKTISDEEFEQVKEHIRKDLMQVTDEVPSMQMLAYTFLPIVFPFIRTPEDKTRPALFLRGETGSGKTFLMTLYQKFYGMFEKVESWSSTPYSILKTGYYFKDAIYAVDDFKEAKMKNEQTFKLVRNIFQDFADNVGRTRLNSSGDIKETDVIRGWLVSTGEDIIAGEASTFARIIPVIINNRPKNLALLKPITKNAPLYSGFTARFIHHVFNINPLLMQKTMNDYEEKFYNITLAMNKSNERRISRNIALLATAFKYIAEFLYPEKQADKMIEKFESLCPTFIDQSTEDSHEELASAKFLNTLKELLATGRIRLQFDSTVDNDPNSRIPIVGYYGNYPNHSGKVICLIMGLAHSEVDRHLKNLGTSIGKSKGAVIQQLFMHGQSFDAKETFDVFNKKQLKVIRLKPGVINELN